MTLTLTYDVDLQSPIPLRGMVMTYPHAGRTDGRTNRRMEAVALPHILMRSEMFLLKKSMLLFNSYGWNASLVCRYFSLSWSTRSSRHSQRTRYSLWCAMSEDLWASSSALRCSLSVKSPTSSCNCPSCGSELGRPSRPRELTCPYSGNRARMQVTATSPTCLLYTSDAADE